MTKLRQCAETAAVALAENRRATPGDIDLAAVADIIEQVLNAAAREQEQVARQRLGEAQATVQERLTQLLSVSPAVIYKLRAILPAPMSAKISTRSWAIRRMR